MAITVIDGPNDDNNPSLPFIVRKLLHQTGSDYEIDIMNRSSLNWRYYEGDQYEASFLGSKATDDGALAVLNDGAALTQRKKELYAGIRPMLQAVTSIVDTDRDHTWVGARVEPIEANDKLAERLKKKWEREGWAADAKLATQYCAVDGCSAIRVIPGWLEGEDTGPSRLEVYSPEVLTVLKDEHNRHNILAAKIEYLYNEVGYDSRDKLTGTTNYYRSVNRINQTGAPAIGTDLTWSETEHFYTMIITEEEYFTFRDHRLHKYGSLGRSWENPLGRVPVEEVYFNNLNRDVPAASFKHILPTLDAVNELASMFGNIVKLNADPVLVAYGIRPNQTITKATTDEGTTIWYVPLPNALLGQISNQAQARIEYLEWSASNVPQMLEFLNTVLEDLRMAMPELHLNKFDKITANSGHAVSLQLQRFIQKIQNIRDGNFLSVERALQMGLVSDDIRRGEEGVSQERARELLVKARDKYDLRIVASPPLPADAAAIAQISNTNVADAVWSKHKARVVQGMTEQESIAEQARIEEEQRSEMKQALEFERLSTEQAAQAQNDQLAADHGMAVQKSNQAVSVMKQLLPLLGSRPGTQESALVLVSELLGQGGVGQNIQSKQPPGPVVVGSKQPPGKGVRPPVRSSLRSATKRTPPGGGRGSGNIRATVQPRRKPNNTKS